MNASCCQAEQIARIFRFIFLIIAELLGFIYLPHQIGKLFIIYTGLPLNDTVFYFIFGWILIVFGFLVITQCFNIIFKILEYHWNKSTEIKEEKSNENEKH